MYQYFGFYVQDDWRVTRKLTVNLGLRYDVTLPPVNERDEYSDFNPTRPNPGADGYPGALWFAGSSGTPIGLMRNNPLPIFNGTTRPLIDSYENWRAQIAGDKFDPNVDRLLKPQPAFPTQPVAAFGNATRYNPKVRGFWNQNENVSLAKTFAIREHLRLDLRGEAFSVFNRTIFSTGSTNLDSATFGLGRAR